MKKCVITAACRTPVGNFGGAFRDMTATQLGVVAVREVIKRAEIEASQIDEVVVGCGGMPPKEANVARQIALFAGLPIETPAFSVQRNCASGLQAITSSVQAIQAGAGDLYLAAGVEQMSGAPYLVYGARWGLRLRPTTFDDSIWCGLIDPFAEMIMGETAERLAERYNISRQEQDEWAVLSHKKAFMAQRMGKFKDEIVPVSVPKKRGEPELVVNDEGPQAGLSLERLALYPTIFREKNGTVTPGNACPMNDAAGAVIVMSEEKARELGKKPLAYVKSYGFAGVDPKIMGIGPVYSTRIALQRAGLELKDIGLIELNEAFAAQYLACQRELGFNNDIANVNGGGIALGHPIGATGLRLINTLTYEMRRRGVKYGLATMCVGGGQGGSVILELPEN
ncbi:MAG TPA: thiolase family protein [Bacillota bacterium]|jgi:acetyl-CoA C-acetyltransferase